MGYYDIGEAFRRIEDQMIASMSRNLQRHLDNESTEGINYTMWQAEQLAALNEYKRNNQKLFPQYFARINDQIDDILRRANAAGSMDQEAAILNAIKRGWRISSPGEHLQGAFFKLNERKMNALLKATKRDMRRAEYAMLRRANDIYRKTIFNAGVFYNSGAGTLQQSVDMATKDFLSRGIDCIEYSNGARTGIDTYARMALKTSQTRAYLQGESTKRDEWGIATVIVNNRGAACPKCLQWVGRVYYDDVYGSVPITDDKYPRLSEAIAGGLYHPNCKDTHTTYFEGISTRPKKVTRAQVDEANRVYALEQKQRYKERLIRKYKRLAEGSVDPENKAKYRARLTAQESNLREFIDAHSDVLKRRPELEKVFPDPLKRTSNESTLSGKSADVVIRQSNIEYKPFDSVHDADEYLKKALGVKEQTNGLERGKINIDVANDIVRTVAEYRNVFGDTLALDSIEKFPKKEYNDVAGAYLPAFKRMYYMNCSSKESAKKIEKEAAYEFKIGSWSTGDPRHVFRHELGHAVHKGIGKDTNRKALQALLDSATKDIRWGKHGWRLEDYKKAGLTPDDYITDLKVAGSILSGYGLSNVDEMVAEAFAEYMAGSPREFAIKVVHTLMGW